MAIYCSILDRIIICVQKDRMIGGDIVVGVKHKTWLGKESPYPPDGREGEGWNFVVSYECSMIVAQSLRALDNHGCVK